MEEKINELNKLIKAYKKYKIPYDIAEKYINNKKLDFRKDKFLEMEKRIIELFTNGGKALTEYINKHKDDENALLTYNDLSFLLYLLHIDNDADKRTKIDYDPIDANVIKEVIESVGIEVSNYLEKNYKRIKEKGKVDISKSIKFDDPSVKNNIINKYKEIAQEFLNESSKWIEEYQEEQKKKEEELLKEYEFEESIKLNTETN